MKITMVGRLDPCYLITYSIPKAVAEGLLPPGLRPQILDGRALWGIVVSRVDRMRPRGMPRFLGSTYVHIAHRIYAEANELAGQRREGLFFVRSDVDKRLMALMGNLMTDFRFHKAHTTLKETPEGISLDVEGEADAGGHLVISFRKPESPSLNLKYAPFGLSTTRDGAVLKIAEVRRDEAAWREEPVSVEDAQWSILDRLTADKQLLGATRVAPIDYVWKIGERSRLA